MQIVEHPGGVRILAAVEIGERHWTAVGHPVTRFRLRSRIRVASRFIKPRLKRPIYCDGYAPFVLGSAASANPAPTNQRASRALVNYCHRRRHASSIYPPPPLNVLPPLFAPSQCLGILEKRFLHCISSPPLFFLSLLEIYVMSIYLNTHAKLIRISEKLPFREAPKHN